MMRHVWRSGAAVAMATLATVAAAQSARAPAGGGWTRDGWSDAPVAGAAAPTIRSDATRTPSDAAPVAGDRVGDEMAASPSVVSGGTIPHGPSGAAEDGARLATLDGGRGRDHRYRLGGRLPAAFATPAYAVTDWAGYGLATPPQGATWVRYYDDAVLLDQAGMVIDARPGIDWAQPPRPYAEAAAPAVRPVPVETEQRRTYTFTTPTTPGTTVSRSPDGRVTVTTVTTPSTTTTTTDSR